MRAVMHTNCCCQTNQRFCNAVMQPIVGIRVDHGSKYAIPDTGELSTGQDSTIAAGSEQLVPTLKTRGCLVLHLTVFILSNVKAACCIA